MSVRGGQLVRILRVNNRYQERGGEDVSYEAESRLLRDRGHDVEFPSSPMTRHSYGGHRGFCRLALTRVGRVPRRNRVRSVARIPAGWCSISTTFPLGVCRRLRGVPEAALASSVTPERQLLFPNATFFRDGHAARLSRKLGALSRCDT